MKNINKTDLEKIARKYALRHYYAHAKTEVNIVSGAVIYGYSYFKKNPDDKFLENILKTIADLYFLPVDDMVSEEVINKIKSKLTKIK